MAALPKVSLSPAQTEATSRSGSVLSDATSPATTHRRRLVVTRPPMSPEQHAMIDHSARVLWIATGTKVGKTVAGAQWTLEGMAAGQKTAWVGPWYKRTRIGFDLVAEALAPASRTQKAVRVRENDMRIDLPNGGQLECFSGDNPESIFAGAYDRVFVDEAARQPSGVLPACLSVTTATRGKIRFAFNLDRPRRNWAVAGFLNAKAANDPEQGWIFLRTCDSPFVSRKAIDEARKALPPHVFAALYEGEIQEDGATVFRNLRGCERGVLEGPRHGRQYVVGVDLAKTFDWTAVVVVDIETSQVVHLERFHGEPWKVQRERIKSVATRYGNATCVVDATGVGDPNVEELVRENVAVEPFVFTSPSKRDLMEGLIVAVENGAIGLPAGRDLDALRGEMEVYEYEARPNGQVSYSAPEGYHDDCVTALALAVFGMGHTSALPPLEKVHVGRPSARFL